MNPHVIKYDYEDAEGAGVIIIYANSVDDALTKFKSYMFGEKNAEWYERVYHRSEFRLVATNIYGWHTFYNDPANVCIKIKEINLRNGEVIPVYTDFTFIKEPIRHMGLTK